MMEFFVKEIGQSELQQELNSFSERGWFIRQIHPIETEQATFWTIICERIKP